MIFHKFLVNILQIILKVFKRNVIIQLGCAYIILWNGVGQNYGS